MNSTGFGCIKVSGGLITHRFITSMQGDSASCEYVQPSTFKIPWKPEDTALDAKEYELRVRDAFESLKSRWNMYESRLNSIDPEEVRKYWQRPLLEALGFNPVYTPKHREISEKLKFNFSHKGWKEEADLPKPPVVHVIPPSQGLDDRPVHGEPSAHDALQAYLDTSKDKWALLTNGLFLRLLRKFHHTTEKGYVEFNIEAIFSNRQYSDFQILYKFAHASRFAPSSLKKTEKTEATDKGESSDTPEIYLDGYFNLSKIAGETVGKDLKGNVIKAIEAFGNGFLTNELMKILREDEKECHIYYEEVMRVIYRIIFLLYAEQRGILGGNGGIDPSIYMDNYSITAHRNFAIETINSETLQHDTHQDLWEGLLTTFKMVRDGVKELGIYPYNGMLFDMSSDKYVGKYGCKNSEFMKAISYLTLTDEKIKQIISYADLSVEEFGAIYESLLEYSPRITIESEVINGIEYLPNKFILDPRGSDRKTTGSYYTNPNLVQVLIKSALDPVIKARLDEADNNPEAKEKAILSIKICDMACGSGAFLIAACNRLGYELARIRSSGGLPSHYEEQDARREVLLHCIYGVDLNPMAVELTKVSLWIDTAVRDKPLNFLDHRIKCGNSLIGTTPELMKKGIPEGAFTPVEGDDKKVASYFKKINKEFLKGIKEQYESTSVYRWVIKEGSAETYSSEFAKLGFEAESTPEQVKEKKEHYESLLTDKKYDRMKFLANLWTSACFWELTGEKNETPTNKTYLTFANNEDIIPGPELEQKINELARKYRFFHWYIEFPEVFSGENSGFDCILGNPPWERIKLQETEFFEYRSPEIANARNAAERKKLIKRLREEDPSLDKIFKNAKRMSECESLFLRESGRFPLTGKGDINTYTVFSENVRNLINDCGYAGIIVPTGIATDNTTSEFFGDLVAKKSLKSLYDFENKEGLFPIHKSFKFCLVTISGRNMMSNGFNFAFFLHNFEDLYDKERHFSLTAEDIKLINPNTLNCPIFRNKRDAEITKEIYYRVPILINENEKDGNPWECSFLRMFDMSNDSHLFKTREELEKLGFDLVSNQLIKGNETFLPLYESKMFWQFDHRFGTFNGKMSRSDTHLLSPQIDDYSNYNYTVQPFYWVNIENVQKNSSFWNRKWFLGYRRISNVTNERTFIFSLLPYAAFGDNVFLTLIQETCLKICGLISNLNCIPFDYLVRQKMGGTNLNYFITKQLPVIPADCYSSNIIYLLAPRAIELTYTAWDLKPFAEDILIEIGPEKWNEWFPDNQFVGGVPQPFKWNEERRLQLRCELDAIYAHLYGISKDDLEYILGTFPIVKRKDEAKYGTYKTKDLILAYYDRYLGLVEPVNKEMTPAILDYSEEYKELVNLSMGK